MSTAYDWTDQTSAAEMARDLHSLAAGGQHVLVYRTQLERIAAVLERLDPPTEPQPSPSKPTPRARKAASP